jgi:prevent-host-death family protein
MTSIETADVVNSFPDLLSKVALGGRIVITDHGKPVAQLAPPDPVSEAASEEARRAKIAEAVERVRALRKGNILGPELTIREMIEEGRP